MKTTARAAVMLTVLVVLPAIWIHFGPLPTGAQRVVDRIASHARVCLGLAPVSAPLMTAITREPELGAAVTSEIMRESMPSALESRRLAAAKTPSIASDVANVSPEFAAGNTAGSPSIIGVEQLLAELRRLGVVQYELEHWGSSGQLYRFQCSMPLSSGADPTRYFESVAPDALATVEQVVADVASWQANRAGRPSVH